MKDGVKRLTAKTFSNNHHKNPSKIDLSEALEMRFQHGSSLKEIGDRFGVSEQRVSQKLNKFINMLKDPDVVKGYDVHKKHLLSAVEFTLLEKLTDEKKLEQANLGNVAYTFKQISDANRLERGKSTSNIALTLEQRLTILHDRGKVGKNSE